MKLMITISIIAFSLIIKAQTYDEFFRQKETQAKYLLKQVAGLQIYLSYARKGYDLVRKGTQVVKSIKEIDFDQHQSFFNALQNINRLIPGQQEKSASETLVHLKQIHQQFLNEVKSSNWMTRAEFESLNQQFKNIERELKNEIQTLSDLASPAIYQLSDDERWHKMEEHQKRIQAYQKASILLRSDIKLLIIYREKEAKESQNSKQINGLKP